MDFLSRRSIRKYKDIPVEKEKLDELLKVAIVAPTGHNARACEFIVFENSEDVKKLIGIKKAGAGFLETAQAGIAIVCDTTKAGTWIEDSSIAGYTIQLKAHEMGLGSCWLQLRDRFSPNDEPSDELFSKIVGLPENYRVLCFIALGYADEEKPSYTEKDMDLSKVHYGKF